MKNFTTLLIFGLVLFGSLFYVYQTKHTLDPNIVFTYSFCDQPITYHVDEVDSQFNLSREQFTQKIDTAAQIWNKQYDTPLFVYDPQGTLSVNLIYDDRQSLETDISKLESKIDANKTPLKSQIDNYNQQSADFKTKVTALNAEIADWNSKGGAPPDVYDQLVQRQKDLRAQADKLNALADSLHQSTQDYNSQINQLNSTINTFNDAISVKPEEGLYRGALNRIEIYFNISPAETTHTITHELGHALGLAHNNNPKSIMYPSSTQTLTLTPDDKQALTDLCRRRSVFENLLSNLKILSTRLSVSR